MHLTRRALLSSAGAAGLVAASVPTTAHGDTSGELPNENIPYSTVNPFGCPLESDQPADCALQEVSPGDWILHTVAWIAQDADAGCEEDADEHHAALQNFLDHVETRAWITGEEIPNAHQYWSSPRNPKYQNVDAELALEWVYFTPPKPNGTSHLFEMEFHFPEDTWAGWNEECERRYHGPTGNAWETLHSAGAYAITSPADQNAGPPRR